MSREAFEAHILARTEDPETLWRDHHDADKYLYPAVQQSWQEWQAAQADAYERAAKVCEDQWYSSECLDAIRALAKEAGK